MLALDSGVKVAADSALKLAAHSGGKLAILEGTPDFAWMHEGLHRHEDVTLQLLWDEYDQADPDGYQHSQFCELCRRWARKIDVVLRQEHHAGEKMLVDHAGPTVLLSIRIIRASFWGPKAWTPLWGKVTGKVVPFRRGFQKLNSCK